MLTELAEVLSPLCAQKTEVWKEFIQAVLDRCAGKCPSQVTSEVLTSQRSMGGIVFDGLAKTASMEGKKVMSRTLTLRRGRSYTNPFCATCHAFLPPQFPAHVACLRTCDTLEQLGQRRTSSLLYNCRLRYSCSSTLKLEVPWFACNEELAGRLPPRPIFP